MSASNEQSNRVVERQSTQKTRPESDPAGRIRAVPQKKLKFDKIGYWSEIKIEIIKKYATAYSKVISAQQTPQLEHAYIDGFAGAGQHVRKADATTVAGSPLAALKVTPPFRRYYFIELEPTRIANLQSLIGPRSDVKIMQGDCNRILLQDVFPHVRFEDYRRGLCILDPYGLHLNWEVIAEAGKMKSIEIFLNFPVLDINRKVLWRDPMGVNPDDIRRMNAYWGDESWRKIAYAPSPQRDLWGQTKLEKADTEVVAEAFRQHLKKDAGFRYVLPPSPMRNTQNAIVYYLFFASPNETGGHIVEKIFDSYRDRRG